jgi:hypothetical protein
MSELPPTGDLSPRAAPSAPTLAPGITVDWRRVHLWQIQPVRDALVIAAVIGLFRLGYTARVVTVPLLVAMLLAYLFEPLVRRLTRSRVMSRQGAALSIILFVAVAVVVPLTLGVVFAVVQGARAAENVAVNIQRVQRSASAPGDAALLSQVPPGPWRSIRDSVVRANAQEAVVAPPSPATAPEDAATPAEPRPEAPPRTGEPGASAQEGAAAAAPRARTRDDVDRLMDWAVGWTAANIEAVAKAVGRQAIGTGADALAAAVRTVGTVGYLALEAFLTAFFF